MSFNSENLPILRMLLTQMANGITYNRQNVKKLMNSYLKENNSMHDIGERVENLENPILQGNIILKL
jgi:hypothetical protein